MSGRTQIPEAGCCPGFSQPLLFIGYQWKGEKSGAESPIKTPVRAHDLGPSKHSQGDSTCRAVQRIALKAVDRDGLANRAFWGLVVSSALLFLIWVSSSVIHYLFIP